jgi:hypothetical protein
MDQRNPFDHLRFERQAGKLSRRTLFLIAIPVGFIIIWMVLPSIAIFWLTLLLVTVLTYAAGFGWEQALDHLIRFLQRQQHR